MAALWHPQNKPARSPEAEIRYYRNVLVISGRATLALFVWSFGKSILNTLLGSTAEQGASNVELPFEIPSPEVAVFILLGLILYLVLDSVLLVYVARAAIAVGHGKRRSPFYIVVAALVATIEIANMILSHLFLIKQVHLGYILVSGIIGLSNTIALVDIVRCSVHLRQLGATSGGDESHAD